MKKYFVIKLVYDAGFWSEEKQDFVGWLGAGKFTYDPRNELSDVLVESSPNALVRAASKKPVVVLEVYENGN